MGQTTKLEMVCVCSVGNENTRKKSLCRLFLNWDEMYIILFGMHQVGKNLNTLTPSFWKYPLPFKLKRETKATSGSVIHE